MTLAQLAALIIRTVLAAAQQTVQQMQSFLNTTVGEVEYLASYFGYTGPGSPGATMAAQVADIDSKVDTLLTGQTDILAAIGNPVQVGDPVTLPTTPPTGYGGSDPYGIWNYTMAGMSLTTGRLLALGGFFARNLGTDMLPEFRGTDTHGWMARDPYAEDTSSSPYLGDIPPLDPTTIIATDTSLEDWLARVYGSLSYTIDDAGSITAYPGSGDATFRHPFDRVQFVLYKAAAFGTPAVVSGVAPIWPGVAGITLGTSAALSGGLTITEPMDGVIVSLTSVPAPRGFYDYDGLASYLNVGSLVFITDDGEAEYFQALGFTSAFFCPKTMVRAAAVKVRAAAGVTGTVQAWTITPG